MRKPEEASLLDFLLLGLGGLAVLFLALSYLQPSSMQRGPSQVSTEDWLKDLKGTRLKPIRLRSPGIGGSVFPSNKFHKNGKPVVLFLFSTDCPYCEDSGPAWIRLSQKLGDRVIITGLNAEDPLTALGWLSDFGIQPDTVISAASSREISTKWGLPGVPVTIAINPQGEILDIALGRFSDEMADHMIEALGYSTGNQELDSLTIPIM